MNGKEKLQYLIDIIRASSEKLISGDIVIVRSDELTSVMTIDEQQQALDKLATDKHISYQTSPLYKSFHEIEPKIRLDINEIASINTEVTEQELEDDLLEIQNYKIKILNLPTTLNIPNKSKVFFDVKTSLLNCGDKECYVPDGTLQHYTCKLVFKNRNVPAEEQDIIDAAGIGNESQRPVYDAMLAVNKLINKNFGLSKYLKFNAGKVRINRIYQG